MGTLFSLSKSSTSIALDISEIALLLFGVLLTVGLIGEYAKSERWKRHVRTFEMFVIIGVAGELLADGGIFLFSSHLQTIADQEIAELTKEAGDARDSAHGAALDAAGAKGSAERANAAAGRAKERADAVAKVAANLARQLRKQDLRGHLFDNTKLRAKFKTTIAPFKGQQFDIRFCPLHDSEIAFLSLKLFDIMSAAGWNLRAHSRGLGCSTGVIIVLDPRSPDSTKTAASALQKALFEIGLATSPEANLIHFSAGRPANPGEELLEPSTIDTVLIEVEGHP
jgi:hypothetical protein